MPGRVPGLRILQSSSLLPLKPRRLAFAVTALSGVGVAYLLLRPRYPTSIDIGSRAASNFSSTLRPMASHTYKVAQYSPPTSDLPAVNPQDFKRVDETDDAHFYADSRFVTHIDDNAIQQLTKYYGSVIPHGDNATDAPIILDLCSSWVSHYPPWVQEEAEEGKLEVLGQGMNPVELRKNPNFLPNSKKPNPKRWAVYDLNVDPSVSTPLAAMGVDASKQKVLVSTLTVSIDYLTQPHAVLASLLEATAPGGSVHLAISNRCFPTKAVRRWLHASEEQRLQMCCEDLWRAGWRNVEIVEVTDGSSPDEDSRGEQQNQGLKSLMAAVGFRSAGDPLWVVRGTKPSD